MDDFSGMHNSALSAWGNRMYPALSMRLAVAVPSPNTWSTAPFAGVLNGAVRIVYGVGWGALDDSVDNYGHAICCDAEGVEQWVYASDNDDVCMGVYIDDIDGDGDNEVLLSFRLKDPEVHVLNGAGEFLWKYNIGVESVYLRPVRSGETRSDYSGKEIITGGRNGWMALIDNTGAEIWKVQVSDPNYPTVQSARIADIDTDGQAEILISSGASVRSHRASDGAQVWSAPLGGANNYSYGLDVGKITTTNGLQIAAAVQYSGIFVLDNAGNVIWSAAGGFGVQWTAMAHDINNDGYAEVFVGHGTSAGGGVRVYDSAGNLISFIRLPKAVKFLNAYDIDGDNVDELIAACDDGNLYILQFAF